MDTTAAMTLDARISEAIRRVTNGNGGIRIPADPTDADLVLADCREAINTLRAALEDIVETVGIATTSIPSVAQAWLKVDDGKAITAARRALASVPS